MPPRTCAPPRKRCWSRGIQALLRKTNVAFARLQRLPDDVCRRLARREHRARRFLLAAWPRECNVGRHVVAHAKGSQRRKLKLQCPSCLEGLSFLFSSFHVTGQNFFGSFQGSRVGVRVPVQYLRTSVRVLCLHVQSVVL